MKQKVSLLAVCAVLLSLFGAGCLAVVLDPGRKAEEQLAAARKEDVFALSPADARSVLEQFAPELRFVERQTGVSIDELNGEALAIIQTQAAREQYNGSYRFGELMDTLAVFCAGHRVGELPLPAAGPTVTTTVQESFGPLRGAVFAQKSAGEPEGQTQTGTVSLPAGSELAGVDLETGCDKTASYTLSGPGPGCPVQRPAPLPPHGLWRAVRDRLKAGGPGRRRRAHLLLCGAVHRLRPALYHPAVSGGGLRLGGHPPRHHPEFSGHADPKGRRGDRSPAVFDLRISPNL